MIADEAALLAQLDAFPLVKKSFTAYLEWIIQTRPPGWETHKLIGVLQRQESMTLQRLENIFSDAQRILGISADQFVRLFGFKTDLLSPDSEKVHDVIAEPLLVVKLAEKGFSRIEKLPKSIKQGTQEIPVADFTAVKDGSRFAIELKTTRTEANIQSGVPSGRAFEPDWWGDMLLANAETKVEGKDFRVVQQLENTCRAYDCRYSLLVFYSRRLGVSALSEPHEYREKLRMLKDKYPVFDFLGFMDYYGTFVIEPDPWM